MSDWFAFALVVTWPLMLALGICCALLHISIWSFFVFYCLTSSPGVSAVALEMWQHGIHNDR